MKKLILILLSLSIHLSAGCRATSNTAKLQELEKYIFEVDENKTLDYDAADEFYAKINDNWGGGCSAVSKMVDGHRLVGRNMDQSISNKCVYIIRTDAGEYKTFGLVYTHRDYSPDYEEVKSKGLSDEFYKVLPFMCDDVLNDISEVFFYRGLPYQFSGADRAAVPVFSGARIDHRAPLMAFAAAPPERLSELPRLSWHQSGMRSAVLFLLSSFLLPF